MDKYISPKQQVALGKQMQGWGDQLTGLQGSMDGSKTNGSLTDNWIPKLDALIPQYKPEDRHNSNPLLQQIVANTGQTAQNTARIGDDVGEATNESLRRAVADIVGVALRQSSRDNYFNARRA